jgi:hypothetical protein
VIGLADARALLEQLWRTETLANVEYEPRRQERAQVAESL